MFLNVENVELKIKSKIILKKQKFEIKKGQNMLVIGPSGSGKTSLLNIMTGLVRPSSGEVIFQNKKYSSLTDNQIDSLRANKFGFIFQKINLIKHLTVEQNILLAQCSNLSKNMAKILNMLDISNKTKEKAMNLSVGEAQRVAIARGLVNQPEIIFADEPTSSLDDKNTKNVIDLILSLAKEHNSSLVVCTHDKRIMNFFKNIIEISL